MPTVSHRSARKIGFFAALAMLLGSVVGIGIFFKNHGVLRANDWDGIGLIVSWVLGGVICLAAALVFSEMGSLRTRGVHGLSGWAMATTGRKFGYFHRFNYGFFYYGILAAAISVFAAEGVINIFVSSIPDSVQPPFWVPWVVGLAFAAMFIVLNYWSAHASGIFQSITTILKFIPLLTVGIAGIALFTTNLAAVNPIPETGGAFGHSAFDNGRSFDFSRMLSSLPGVLFAYDAFLGVGSLSNKMVGGVKRVPFIVVVGMGLVIGLYSLIAIAAVAHGSGLVTGSSFGAPAAAGLGIFDQIFAADVAKGMGVFVNVFVAISALGVLNGISATLVATSEQAINTHSLFGSRRIIKRFGPIGVLWVTLSVAGFWALAFGIPALIMESDAIIDGISNFPTLFSFAMYVPIIIAYAIKRNRLDVKKIASWIIWPSVAIAVAGILLVVGYQMFYSYSVRSWIEMGDTANSANTNWGLFFAPESGQLYYWQSFIVLASTLVAFFAVPFINAHLIRKYENRDPFEPVYEAETFAEELANQSGTVVTIPVAGSVPVRKAGTVPFVLNGPLAATSSTSTRATQAPRRTKTAPLKTKTAAVKTKTKKVPTRKVNG